MLSTGQVDLGILRAFEHQFYALDKTRDGTVTLEDFPDGMGLRKTHSKLNKTTTTFIEVVDYKSAYSQPVTNVADSIKKVQHESLEARVLYEMEEKKGLHAEAKEKAQQKAHHAKGHRQTSQRDADAWTAAHASPKQHKASLVAAMCVDAALERKAAPEETNSRVPAEPNSVAHDKPESSVQEESILPAPTCLQTWVPAGESKPTTPTQGQVAAGSRPTMPVHEIQTSLAILFRPVQLDPATHRPSDGAWHTPAKAADAATELWAGYGMTLYV